MITTADRLADRYVLGELLGQGGMGAVYRAEDERLGRVVAVKVLSGVTEAHSARLQQEARVLARLDHPALVRILDADEHDGQPFIVMDLVEGQTLRDRLADGALDEASARSMATQVAEGLVHAHANGVIHRDLKPANIVLGADGRARVVDFGIARLADVTGLTRPGTAVGTAAYLAPEQLEGEGSVGPPADVYTLGLVLLESLTGTRPFEGGAVETALARLHEAPEIPAGLPAPWPDLLARMTALDPAARPDAAEVAEALSGERDPSAVPGPAAGDATSLQTAAMQSTTPTKAMPTPDTGAEPSGPPPDLPVRRGRARPWRTSPRHRALVAAAALAVVLLVVLGLLLVARGDDPTAEPAQDPNGPTIPADVADALAHLRESVEP